MPQAEKRLRILWQSDFDALLQIEENCIIEAGIIRWLKGYIPTERDLSAAEYLFQEWDYGIE